MEHKHSAAYWRKRYETAQTQWDLGLVSPPIKAWFDDHADKNARILIPGAGNAHEAEYLWRQGFKQVYVCDWAAEALANFSKRCPGFPVQHLICSDFFELDGQWDIIVEQTFFCALPPAMRAQYASKMPALLMPDGVLLGVFFACEFSSEGPPYGGTAEEYEALFTPAFSTVSIQACASSVGPRLGRELWLELRP